MIEQNLENHGRFVPSYHFFAVPVFVINFLWSLYKLKQLGITFEGIFGVVLAAALVVLVFRARLFALAVQDRVIRLEERLRYERVLPADLRTRCGELTIGQIVSLRFASDAELPARLTAGLLENTANHATLGTDGGTIDRNCLRAGDKSNDGCYFLGSLKAFEKRSGTDGCKELFLEFSR